MWPDRVSNPGPLTYESGALPTALCGPAGFQEKQLFFRPVQTHELGNVSVISTSQDLQGKDNNCMD